LFLLKKIAFFCMAALPLASINAHAAEGLFPKPTVMAAPAIPTPAPEFVFANVRGGALKLADMKGKVVVIRYWAMW
jgi:hypothetical protein